MRENLIVAGAARIELEYVQEEIKGGKKSQKVVKKELLDEVRYLRVVGNRDFLEISHANNEKIFARFERMSDVYEALKMVNHFAPAAAVLVAPSDWKRFEQQIEERRGNITPIIIEQ